MLPSLQTSEVAVSLWVSTTTMATVALASEKIGLGPGRRVGVEV